MSILEDVLAAWREVHERGDCVAHGEKFGTQCPFCVARERGVDVCEVMEG